MPELCRFDGIIIRMFTNDHPPPHFHAAYGGFRAKFDILNPDHVDGQFPVSETRKVKAWALERREELLAAWARAEMNRSIGKVAPPSR